MKYISFFLTFFFLLLLHSQSDTLFLYNGKKMYDLQVIKVDSFQIEYLLDKQKKVNAQGRLKPKVIGRSNVFEIIYADGKHEILYIQDSIENLGDTNQMKSYVNGSAFARKYYHNYTVGPVVFLVTIAAYFLDINPVYTLSIPGVVGLILVYTVPTFPKKVLNQQVDEYFILGYQDMARNKLIKNAVVWGSSGFLLDLMLAIIH